MDSDGLPWLRLLLVLAFLSALFVIPIAGLWADERRKRRLPPVD
jgi:maltodextrin utilization protein YvdJ